MLKISKAEAKLIRAEFPNCKLPATCRDKNDGKKRGVAYIEESEKYLTFLNKIRTENILLEYDGTKN